MTTDLMRYDTMVESALRGVMIEALGRAATMGMPGDHHFYIEFDTRHAGVRLAAELFAQHPETMTIVLQNQFWDLDVSDERFTVGLAFSGIRHSLTVPFDSVVGFADPSVDFRLQFQIGGAEAGDAAGGDPALAPHDETSTAGTDAGADGESAEVVTLDAFRKK